MGVFRIRCGLDCRGGCVPQIVGASTRVRQLRARPRQVRPRREGPLAAGRNPETRRTAIREPRPRASRSPEAWYVRRRRRFRSRDDRRQGHVRTAAPVRGRRAARIRQRRPGFEGRGAHGQETGTGALGTGAAGEFTRWSASTAPRAPSRTDRRTRHPRRNRSRESARPSRARARLPAR